MRIGKRSRLISGIVVFTILCVLLIAWLERTKIQSLTLADGSKVQFLGITKGTNHWNPATPFLSRAIYRVPAISSVLFSLLPKSARSEPSIAVISKPGGVLWFFVEKEPLFGQLVFRCLNKDGEFVGASGNLDFRSTTNATAIWLQSMEFAELTNIHSIEIYSRDMPLSGVMNGPFNPISEMDIYPGLRVGEFNLPQSTSRH
jgi:hypothetical protein